MNQTEDTLTVVAGLQPASLDRLADEGYARRRAGDLARLMAEPAKPAQARAPPPACRFFHRGAGRGRGGGGGDAYRAVGARTGQRAAGTRTGQRAGHP